jgi:hypothetical protein
MGAKGEAVQEHLIHANRRLLDKMRDLVISTIRYQDQIDYSENWQIRRESFLKEIYEVHVELSELERVPRDVDKLYKIHARMFALLDKISHYAKPMRSPSEKQMSPERVPAYRRVELWVAGLVFMLFVAGAVAIGVGICLARPPVRQGY